MKYSHIQIKRLFNQYSLMGFVVGVTATLPFLYIYKNSSKPEYTPESITRLVRQGNTDYKFIKPLLFGEYSGSDYSAEFFNFEREIKEGVEDKLAQRPDDIVAVYFRDLSNASWVGVITDEKFIPASLLKVPMLISYYKLSEKEPGLFDQLVKFTGDDLNVKRNLDPDGVIVPGQTYSVKQLLEAMIINSDNNAYELLRLFRTEALRGTFEDLDTPLPEDPKHIALKDFLTVDKLSKFFVVLYNGSYISNDHSEAALELLSKTTFKDGIAGGVPEDIIVSHKFGERIVGTEDNPVVAEFHDCGVFYHPDKSYILCIMTKGKNLDSQALLTKQISESVYNIIQKHH